MSWLLLAIFVIVAVVIVIRFQRHLERQERRNSDTQVSEDPFKRDVPVGGDPLQIRIRDIVEYLGQSYAVRGTVRYTDGPFHWTEHYLDDASGSKRWISVEEDPDLEVFMWTSITDHGLNPEEHTLFYGGIPYARIESGSAIFTSSGTTGLPESGRVEYVDYKAPNGRRLSCERYGGTGWEASIGEEVPVGSMTIYPVARFEVE